MFSAINRTIKRMVLRQQKAKPIVRISDTTLRDGLQTPGVRLGVPERVAIARALADAGIHSIDIGFPATSAAEAAAVRHIARSVKGPILSVLARTKREDVELAAELLSVVSPFKRAITLFLGTSPLHRDHKHHMSKKQVIETIVNAIDIAQKHFEVISFGPEDASRTEPDFLVEVYREAIKAGAISIGFTDTVGILTPKKAADTVKMLQDRIPNMDDAMLGVHFHNDLGMATANSLACVEAGANMVQGTINGVGERAGNTAIEEVVLALTLHKDQYRKDVSVDPASLFGLSKLVSELTGFHPAANKAVVGRNLFRTETGVHQDGLLQHPDTYMPFPPELIGAGPVELVLGRNSGRSAIRHHLEAAGMEVSEEHVQLVMDFLKNESHTPDENVEIRTFIERLRPYMATDEMVAKKLHEIGVQSPEELRDASTILPSSSLNAALGAGGQTPAGDPPRANRPVETA